MLFKNVGKCALIHLLSKNEIEIAVRNVKKQIIQMKLESNLIGSNWKVTISTVFIEYTIPRSYSLLLLVTSSDFRRDSKVFFGNLRTCPRQTDHPCPLPFSWKLATTCREVFVRLINSFIGRLCRQLLWKICFDWGHLIHSNGKNMPNWGHRRYLDKHLEMFNTETKSP